MDFTDIRRMPDAASLETASGFEKMSAGPACFSAPGVRLAYEAGRLVVSCPRAGDLGERAPKRFRLRWHGDNRAVVSVLRDAWQCAYADIGWEPMRPERVLPWYFMAYDGARTYGCGVKTGPDAFVFWQLDARGVTLWLDVRCGGVGVEPSGPLTAAEIVTFEGAPGETPYACAQRFAAAMCPSPKLPGRPVFGSNNWYYAYGDISAASVREDAALMGSLVDGALRPYLVIDDGWQKNRRRDYIGGPWTPNERFRDMEALARDIRERGCLPGLWMRPTLAEDPSLPEAWRLRRPVGAQPAAGYILDPSVPDVLEHIRGDVRRATGWGYALIKHDFSTYDLSGMSGADVQAQLTPEGWSFADRTRTTAQIVKALYQTVQDAAGGALVLGCNTYSHLTAGIHALMRAGGDTSGRVWEITRKTGINTLAQRLYQNGRFFKTDADCAAFTPKVPASLNLRFLELCAMSGSAAFASITPNFLNARELAELRRIYALAAAPGGELVPLDWMTNACPGEYLFRGKRESFDWFTETDGVRTFYTWFG